MCPSHLILRRGLTWCGTYEGNRRITSITTLSDDVLLDIFHFYKNDQDSSICPVWTWHILVHVCQRWRQVVFASPQDLKLQIFCTYGTPVRKNLGIWPALPIVLDYSYVDTTTLNYGNIIAALEHPDRVCSVQLNVTASQLRKLVTAMQKPFPVLTHLSIVTWDPNGHAPSHVPVLSAEFLGGSAPRLQQFTLNCVPFPSLPTFLLSTNALVKLDLLNIPQNGSFSPKAMVACLAALPKLDTLSMVFQCAPRRANPNRICPPPVTQTFLPALTDFRFHGASEYLEDLVPHISSPQLKWIYVQFLDQPAGVPQLAKFIDRSMGPDPFRRVDVSFKRRLVALALYRHEDHAFRDPHPAQTTFCQHVLDAYDVSHVAQVFSQFSDTLSNILHVRLWADPDAGSELEGTDGNEWLHLLRGFSNMQTLYVSQTLASDVARALEDITTATEALPSVNLICLEDQPASSVEKFVAARRLADRPVTIIDTEAEYDRVARQ